MNHRFTIMAVAVAVWTVVNCATTFGQAPASTTSEEIKLFRTEYVDPDAASSVLSNLFSSGPGIPPTKFAIDRRTGVLIVKGSKSTLETVAQLLKSIDVKMEKKNRISFSHLNHASAVDIQGLIAQSVPSSTVQSETRTNSVLVEVSNDADEAKVSELIKLLDLPRPVPASSEPKDVSVRIVWLVDKSLTREGAEAVPADLERPIEALRKKLSLGELRLATQSSVRCSASTNSSFSAAGSAALNRPYLISFHGQVMHRGANSYQLEVSGSTNDPESNAVAGQLRTTCSNAVLGQPIIIGTTSLESKPSVFVVQIMEN